MDTNKVLSISVWNLPEGVFSEAGAKKRKSFHELVAKTVGTHIGIEPQQIEIRTMRQLVVGIDPKKNPRKAIERGNPSVSIQITWCDEHRGAQNQEIGGDVFHIIGRMFGEELDPHSQAALEKKYELPMSLLFQLLTMFTTGRMVRH